MAVVMVVGFIVVVGSKRKAYEDVIKAEATVITEMNSNGHRVKHMVFDDEAGFVSAFSELDLRVIHASTFPAGMKNSVEIKKLELNVRKMERVIAETSKEPVVNKVATDRDHVKVMNVDIRRL